MINIIPKSHKHLMKTEYANYKVIDYPELLFKQVSSLLYKKGDSKEVEKILKEIDGCTYLGSDNLMVSKFNGVPLQLSYMSTGGQIALCIYYLCTIGDIDNKIFNVSSCGNNVIHYIIDNYSNYNLTFYLGHTRVFGSVNNRFLVNGRQTNKLADIFKESEYEDNTV